MNILAFITMLALLGSWHTHYMRLRHPLSGSHQWYACDGTSVVRPFWGGSGDLEDGDLRCPSQPSPA